MDEQDWDEIFTRAAEGDRRAAEFDVWDDLARGREHLYRRRLLTAVSGLAVAAVVGAVLLGTSFAAGPRAEPAPAGPGEPSAAVTTASGQPTMATPTPPQPLSPPPGRVVVDPMEQLGDLTAWRGDLFHTTESVIDPQGTHLNYDTQSLQSGGDGKGGIHLGIKMGWTVPGQPGEGMVQVTLSTEHGPDAPGCWEYPVTGCRPAVTTSGLRYRIGHGSDGQLLVVHEQPDGERVLVYVDPLFGNNSTVPVAGMTVTERDVLRLVQDDRLDLPRS